MCYIVSRFGYYTHTHIVGALLTQEFHVVDRDRIQGDLVLSNEIDETRIANAPGYTSGAAHNIQPLNYITINASRAAKLAIIMA
ncbi:MAG: hypothetical protein ACJ70T_05465 [Nitrososphaera sp.]